MAASRDQPHETTHSKQPMTNHTAAKQEFLTWLSEQAEKNGTELTIDRGNELYHREPDVLARLRATTKTSRFQTRDTDDERSVSHDIKKRFNRVLCVILQLRSPRRFNPGTDHYYPLRIATVQRHTGKKHASGEYQLNFDFDSNAANHYRDDLEVALGLPRKTTNTQVGPSETSSLQEIARKVCRESETTNERSSHS